LPTISWQKADEVIVESERFKIKSADDGTFSLTISEVQETDYAEYTAKATSAVGENSAAAELTLTSEFGAAIRPFADIQQQPPGAAISPAGRADIEQQPSAAAGPAIGRGRQLLAPPGAAISPAGRADIEQQPSGAAAGPAIGRGRQLLAPPAAAIPPAGRGIPLQPPAAAAAIPAVGRGHRILIEPAAAAAAIPAVGRGQHNHPHAVAAASLAGPVRQDQHVQPHMLVLNDLFDFVTRALRSGATIWTFARVGGYRNTYSIQGKSFFNSLLYFYLLIISSFL
jgi:hypothetical protein